jgi:molybdenum cofactor biosynthesis protein B
VARDLLTLSHGGHHHRHAVVNAAVALLTVSDTRTEATDETGRAARRLLEGAGHRVAAYEILPDEPEQIGRQLRLWLDRAECDCIVVMGGTGISPRDRTYEAVAQMLDMRLDGFGELFRALSYEQVGSAAMLSRAVGGVVSGRLLFSLPGARAAVELALEKLIVPQMGHLLSELRRQ